MIMSSVSSGPTTWRESSGQFAPDCVDDFQARRFDRLIPVPERFFSFSSLEVKASQVDQRIGRAGIQRPSRKKLVPRLVRLSSLLVDQAECVVREIKIRSQFDRFLQQLDRLREVPILSLTERPIVCTNGLGGIRISKLREVYEIRVRSVVERDRRSVDGDHSRDDLLGSACNVHTLTN